MVLTFIVYTTNKKKTTKFSILIFLTCLSIILVKCIIKKLNTNNKSVVSISIWKEDTCYPQTKSVASYQKQTDII